MRILIADDNPVVRRGITGILSKQRDWEVCGEAEDGVQTFQKASELNPDVVLLDVMMPGASGLQAARVLRAQSPHVKIIIMSEHDPNHLVSHAIQAGADACVDKARIASDLVTTIRGVTASLASQANPERLAG